MGVISMLSMHRQTMHRKHCRSASSKVNLVVTSNLCSFCIVACCHQQARRNQQPLSATSCLCFAFWNFSLFFFFFPSRTGQETYAAHVFFRLMCSLEERGSDGETSLNNWRWNSSMIPKILCTIRRTGNVMVTNCPRTHLERRDYIFFSISLLCIRQAPSYTETYTHICISSHRCKENTMTILRHFEQHQTFPEQSFTLLDKPSTVSFEWVFVRHECCTTTGFRWY